MASKERERAIFDLCRDAVPGFPEGPAEDYESPDFLVRSGDRTIGVEMQEFIQGAGKGGAPARQAESARDQIMQKAQQEFEARNPGSYPYVYPYWVRPVSWHARTPRDLPARIRSLVERVLREPLDEGAVMAKRDATYPELEAEGLVGWLTHLTVLLFAPATHGQWSSSEWGYVSQDLAALADQVHAKDMKLPAYHAACDEIWLVLYSWALPSGSFDMDVLDGQRLRWVDIDLDRGTLRVAGALQRFGERFRLVEPKSASSRRTIPVPPLLVPILRSRRAIQAEAQLVAGSAWDESIPGLVFTSTLGHPLHGVSVTQEFQSICARARLPQRRFHDLRHGTATLLLAAGVDLKTISTLLGHSTITLTANTYAGVVPALTSDAMERLGALLTPVGLEVL